MNRKNYVENNESSSCNEIFVMLDTVNINEEDDIDNLITEYGIGFKIEGEISEVNT